MGRGSLGAALALACVSTAAVGAPRAFGQVITQADWSRRMVTALGIAEGMPSGGGTDVYAEFLAGEPIPPIRIEGAQAASLPAGARVERDPASGKFGAIRAGASGAIAEYRVRVPAGGIYALYAEAGDPRGAPAAAHHWRVDGGKPVTSQPAPGLAGGANPPWPFNARLVGYHVLSRGEHAVSDEIPAGGKLTAFALVRQPFPHVRPPDGWRDRDALTYGVKAVTMVQAMQLEDELPELERWSVVREGERPDRVWPKPASAGAADAPEKLSAGRWMAGTPEGVTLLYEIDLPRPCTYSVLARMAGTGGSRWILDARVERSVTPARADRLDWIRVTTLPLGKGRHRLGVRLTGSAGLDAIRLVCRDGDPLAALLLLRDLGFGEKSPEEPVTAEMAHSNLDNPFFRQRVEMLTASFFTFSGPGPGPWGGPPAGEGGIILPTDEAPPETTTPISE
jgi:hypothetical protein